MHLHHWTQQAFSNNYWTDFVPNIEKILFSSWKWKLYLSMMQKCGFFFLYRLSELGSITCCYLNPHILKPWKMTFWTKKVKSNKQKFSLSFFLYNFCYFLCYLVKLAWCMYNNATSGTLELCACRHGTYKYLYLLVLPSMKKRLSYIVRLVNGKSLG